MSVGRIGDVLEGVVLVAGGDRVSLGLGLVGGSVLYYIERV